MRRIIPFILITLTLAACQPASSSPTNAPTDAPLLAPTDTPAPAVAPLSADEVLAAVEGEGGAVSLVAVDIPTGTTRVLIRDRESITGDGGFIDLPARSPDGSRLAFARSVIVTNANGFETVNQGIWVSGLDGSGMRQVAAPSGTFEYSDPVWSPDAARIAFLSNEFGGKTYVVGLDGTPPAELTTAGPKPRRVSWSPDGTRLLYTSDRREGSTLRRGIFVYDLAAGIETALVVAENVIFSTPAWSPDGTRITYIRWNSADELQEVFVSGADGSDPVNLTPGQAYAYDPQFSPDGQLLAYNHYDTETKTYALAVLTLDGSAERRIVLELPGNRSGPDW